VSLSGSSTNGTRVLDTSTPQLARQALREAMRQSALLGAVGGTARTTTKYVGRAVSSLARTTSKFVGGGVAVGARTSAAAADEEDGEDGEDGVELPLAHATPGPRGLRPLTKSTRRQQDVDQR